MNMSSESAVAAWFYNNPIVNKKRMDMQIIQATLQFCLVKPLMAVCIVILQALNLYTEGDFSYVFCYFVTSNSKQLN